MIPAIDRRKLTELALEAGRRYLSPQTGLVHYCYEKQDASDTIPLFENLCYSLALFRTLLGNLVQEGKERLQHLLAFRTKEGCFPVYLHEYPNGTGSYRTMYPLFLIEKHFHKVIEKPLLSKIRQNLTLPLPPKMITSSREAGLMALDLTCRGASLDSLFPLWDFEKGLYVGPLGDERQRKGEMETTLFDLFMGCSPRILKPHPIHLHASLVFPSENQIKGSPVVAAPPKVVGQGYHLYRKVWQEGEHFHTLVCQDIPLANQKLEFCQDQRSRFNPLEAVSYPRDRSDAEGIKDRVPFEGKNQLLKYEGYKDLECCLKSHNSTDFSAVFVYPEIIPDEKNRMELNLYTDRAKGKIILINGEKGTVFKLGDHISIKTPEKVLTFTFKIVEGEGDFLGRLSFGNRPAQIETDLFTAYDWKIGIRSLRRTPQLRLALEFI